MLETVRTLDEERKQWENPKYLKPVLVVPIVYDDHYGILLVVLQNLAKEGKYDLNRYFPTGRQWVCSIEMSNESLETCLNYVSKLMSDQYDRLR